MCKAKDTLVKIESGRLNLFLFSFQFIFLFLELRVRVSVIWTVT